MTYLELALKRLARMRETASKIQVSPKEELDKIDLSSLVKAYSTIAQDWETYAPKADNVTTSAMPAGLTLKR